MAEITAAMVKELRIKTDAPMMECKKALVEASGDLDKAEEILRVKLGSKASKASSRVTAEGLIGIYISADGKLGSIVEVNCETDFVAKNEDFIGFVDTIGKLVAEQNPTDLEALSAISMGEKTVEEVRTALIGKIGENMSVRRVQRVEAKGRLASYNHGGKIGVLVDFSSNDEQVGKDVAMHIAATKPKALDETGVSADDIEKERSVAKAKAIESGKPAEIAEKMVEGSVKKFLKEVTLLSQPFVKNDKQSVSEMLKSTGSELFGFNLYIVGEGIEKKANDFAAEVAAQAAAAGK